MCLPLVFLLDTLPRWNVSVLGVQCHTDSKVLSRETHLAVNSTDILSVSAIHCAIVPH